MTETVQRMYLPRLFIDFFIQIATINLMDNIPTNTTDQLTPQMSQEKKVSIKKIFLSIGFEVVFTIVILAIFLVLANYFNILPVSGKLRFLSFLPNQKKTVISRTEQFSTPSPTPDLVRIQQYQQKLKQDYVESMYSYDANNAANLLKTYVQSNLIATVPANLQVTQRLGVNNQPTDTVSTFGAYWKNNEDEYYAAFHYNTSSNIERDMSIFAITTSLIQEDNAIILAKYFKITKPFSPTCKSIEISSQENIQVCEVFWVDANGIKNGEGVVQDINTSTDGSKEYTRQAYVCKIPTNSDNYSWKSCIQQFKDTGV